MNYPKISASIYNALDDNQRDFLNIVQEHFPNVIKDGIVDFDALKEAMGNIEQPEGEEKYELTWAGKQESKREYLKEVLGKTLKFKLEDSLNADTTENLYIEGDNLEVMKLLKRNYRGKIKMIYIDPPYNTGNDFIYNDRFKYNQKELAEASNNLDKDGNPLQKNSREDSQFHSKWLNMMYPRLKIARDLLSEDGVIFISIGDDEEANLIKLCDEIFGNNFIASICHKHRASVSNDRIISENHNHLVFYSRNIEKLFERQKLIGEDPILEGFNHKDDKGEYKLTPVDGPGGAKKGNPHYEFLGVTGYWRYSKETMQEKYEKGLIIRTPNGLQQKYYKSQAELSRRTVTTWWDEDFLTSSATKNLTDLMEGKIFDNPKSLNLLLRCLKMIVKFSSDSIILDFFSGSATTAHAVMQLNAEDGGNRKFIMVQIPEKCDNKSEAYKAGFKNICEIGKERIRRAGKKIKDDLVAEIESIKKEIEKEREKWNREVKRSPFIKGNGCDSNQGDFKENNEKISLSANADIPLYERGSLGQNSQLEALVKLEEKLAKKESILTNLDIGFKCFEVADTNIKWIYDEVYKTPQKQTFSYKEDNARSDKDRIDFTPGFTDIDVVYELMLRQYGIPLSTKIEKLSNISDRTYIFADTCVVCLDDNITDDIVTKLADIEPIPAVYILRDSAFGDDIALKDYTYRKLTAMIQGNLNKDELNNRFNNFKVEFI